MKFGQFSTNPERKARFLFFEELKKLAPEAIEDLKTSCLELREKQFSLCIALAAHLRKQLEKNVPDKPKSRERKYRMMIDRGDLEKDEEYVQLQEKYWASLEEWTNRWNLGRERWKNQDGLVIIYANRVIESLLDSRLLHDNPLFSQNKYIKIRIEENDKIDLEHSITFGRPEKMNREFSSDWRNTLEEDQLFGEELIKSIELLRKDGESKLFTSLFNESSLGIPEQQILYVPISHDFFLTEHWDPSSETRGDFTKRIKEKFDKELEEYLSKKEANAKEIGMQPTRIALTRKPRGTKSIFEWLIRFQVQGFSKNRIAKNFNVTQKAVRESINSKASLIGLIPRE
jgi:hypothetical protein